MQCDDDYKEVEYEEVENTLWHSKCEIVDGEECNLETVIKKKPLEETVCNTVPENRCETVIKMETDKECKIISKKECELVDKPSSKYIQVRPPIC